MNQNINNTELRTRASRVLTTGQMWLLTIPWYMEVGLPQTVLHNDTAFVHVKLDLLINDRGCVAFVTCLTISTHESRPFVSLVRTFVSPYGHVIPSVATKWNRTWRIAIFCCWSVFVSRSNKSWKAVISFKNLQQLCKRILEGFSSRSTVRSARTCGRRIFRRLGRTNKRKGCCSSPSKICIALNLFGNLFYFIFLLEDVR